MSKIVDALQTYTPAPVGGAGTNPDIFQYNQLPFAPSGIAAPGAVSLKIPGTARLDGKIFKVTASGNVTVAGQSPTVQVTLYAALPGGSNVALATSSVRAVTTGTSAPWTIEADLQGDQLSGILQGWFSDAIASLVDTQAALTNGLTGVNFGTNSASGQSNGASYPTSGYLPTNAGDEPVITLQVAITFGVSNTANTATLKEFYASSPSC